MALVVLRSINKQCTHHQHASSNKTDSSSSSQHHQHNNKNDSKPRYCGIRGRKSFITVVTTIIVLCIIIANYGHDYIITKANYYNKSSDMEKNPKNGRTAVATLISNDEMLQNFCYTIKSLTQNHIIDETTSVLVFHEGELPMYNKKINLMKCATSHRMIFERIQFTYPDGYRMKNKHIINELEQQHQQRQSPNDNSYSTHTPPIISAMTDKWVNHRTIFWTTILWDHPLIHQFSTILRINPGSCFIERGIDATDTTLPSLPPSVVYRSHGPLIRPDDESGGRLINFAQSYMHSENIAPRNPELWSHIKDTYEKRHSLPVFHTDFEVIRLSFLRREDVRRWHRTITIEPPFRSFKNKWKDYQIRVVTMAMFAESKSLLLKKHHSYVNSKHVCLEAFGGGEKEMGAAHPV